MSATELAAARRTLDTAQAEHEAAAGKCQSIRERIAAASLRQSEITTARINGQSNAADTAEYAALVGDVEALKGILETAEADAAAKLATQHDAHDKLRIAEQQHAMERTREAFDALKARAEMLEAALCGCVAELHAHGQKLGHVSLVMSFRPSQRLANIVQGIRL